MRLGEDCDRWRGQVREDIDVRAKGNDPAVNEQRDRADNNEQSVVERPLNDLVEHKLLPETMRAVARYFGHSSPLKLRLV